MALRRLGERKAITAPATSMPNPNAIAWIAKSNKVVPKIQGRRGHATVAPRDGRLGVPEKWRRAHPDRS